MLIAVDESGSPAASSDRLTFFVGVHFRQRKTIYRMKQAAFRHWEESLPASLKDHNGEIKGKVLSDAQLAQFARDVMVPQPPILVTAVGLRPSSNPPKVVDKHRALQAEGIKQGMLFYKEHQRDSMARLYEEFGHWFENLSYDQYLKIVLLGECIARSLINAFGHSIAGGCDYELMRLRYVIDRDFVREERSNAFWHELLRNQLWHSSEENPLPILDRWTEKGHPVLDKYSKSGRFNLNDLFWNNLSFVRSHKCLEVRVADTVATVLSRNFNKDGQGLQAYELVRMCIAAEGAVHFLILSDFDLSKWTYHPEDNPWLDGVDKDGPLQPGYPAQSRGASPFGTQPWRR